MPDIMILLPIALVIFLFVGAGMASKSMIMAAGGGLMAFGYIAVQSGNALYLGFYIIIMLFLTLSAGVLMTRTVIGETA